MITKRIINLSLMLSLALLAAACGKNEQNQAEKSYAVAPMIVINRKQYFANTLDIVNQLPEGYEYGGELTDEQLKYADIDGTEYYFDKRKEALYDFYVYQECGTPMSDDALDNTARQWAYVKWSLRE